MESQYLCELFTTAPTLIQHKYMVIYQIQVSTHLSQGKIM